MKFTIEQLEKIIGGATDNSVWFRPISNCYYDKDFYRVDVIGVSLMPYYYSTCSKLADLQKSLQEMKMKEEVNEVANNEWIDGVPNYGDECIAKGVVDNQRWYMCVNPKNPTQHMTVDINGYVDIYNKGDFSKPLNPEQKQAQINEKNAIKLHDLANANYPAYAPNDWDSATVEVKEMWIAVANKVTFKDEIDS